MAENIQYREEKDGNLGNYREAVSERQSADALTKFSELARMNRSSVSDETKKAALCERPSQFLSIDAV